MRQMLPWAALGLALVLGATPAGAQDRGKEGKGGGAHFVMKASASDLAEINLSQLAAKRATMPEVQRFAQQMVTDHTKTLTELTTLANTKGLRLAATMDAKAQSMA